MGIWKRVVTSLMGVTYDYPTVEAAPLVVSHTTRGPMRPVSLDTHDPELASHEALIREHRRHDANSEVPVLPRSTVEQLLHADVPVTNAAVAKDADTAGRQRRALEADYADVPVLPPVARTKNLSDTELQLYEKQRLRAIKRDQESLVPVQRRAS